MQQLYSVMPTGRMGVNPKLPAFTLKMSLNGSSSSSSASSSLIAEANAKYQEEYDALTNAQKTKVDQANNQTTVYSCYPCEDKDTTGTPNLDEWKNFVKYCVIKGQVDTLGYFMQTWSQTVNTTGGTTTTYNPTEDNRQAALNLYNEYIADNGATTGVKPACADKGQVDVTNSWSQNLATNFTYA